MAISTQERTNVVELVVGMFNASPGATYLDELTGSYELSGNSLVQVARMLANTPLYYSIAPQSQTAAQFAAYVLTPFNLQNDAIAIDFVTSRFNAGMNKGQII